MKKLFEFVVKCLRDGIPLGKAAVEFWLLINPFLKRERGHCPACNVLLWEKIPDNPVDAIQTHVKICPKSKERVAHK